MIIIGVTFYKSYEPLSISLLPLNFLLSAAWFSDSAGNKIPKSKCESYAGDIIGDTASQKCVTLGTTVITQRILIQPLV